MDSTVVRQKIRDALVTAGCEVISQPDGGMLVKDQLHRWEIGVDRLPDAALPRPLDEEVGRHAARQQVERIQEEADARAAAEARAALVRHHERELERLKADSK